MDPVRTCIATRTRATRSSLLRVVVQNGRIVADPAATKPGRGAWLTPTMQAYESAVRRKAFRRALRLDSEPDTSEILHYLQGLDTSSREHPHHDSASFVTQTEQAERLMDN